MLRRLPGSTSPPVEGVGSGLPLPPGARLEEENEMDIEKLNGWS